ncbi:MAG TPA: DUF4118 domain-containing protein [Gammaproteobacteria bacterium]|nr:DUF4118 domain-containing protein [Gammaproteobacteria bacterium]
METGGNPAAGPASVRPPRRGGLVYLWTTLSVALATVAASLGAWLLPHANLSLLYLTAVLVVAARWGLWPSLYAALLGFLAFNFFNTPPYYTWTVHDEADVATLVFFLLMAAIAGSLAARMHRAMAESRAALHRLSNLREFSGRMAAALGREDIVRAVVDSLERMLDVSAVVLVPEEQDGLAPAAYSPAAAERVPVEQARRAWAYAGRECREGGWYFIPLTTGQGTVGLVGVHNTDASREQMELARGLCGQAAVALERAVLAAELEQERLKAETEQLRSALLSSVSHDLRTPLASIIGAATSLIEYGGSFSAENRRALMETVLQESQRLDRYVQNLLDMTRLDQGRMPLQRDWVDLNDLVSAAQGRLHSELEGLRVEVAIADDLPLLYVHGALIEQVLVNILDNAVRFSPSDGVIRIDAAAENGGVVVDISDQGPGIPEEARGKVFDMFFSARQGDRQSQGTGLGLAICKGLVAAHGGNIEALGNAGGNGTRIRVRLPALSREQVG